MPEEPLTAAGFFLVYPENAKFARGETSFEAGSRRKRRIGMTWLAVVVLTVVGACTI